MRTQSIFARLIRYIVIGAVASSALMCAQLGVTNAKYKKTYTYPDNQFSIIRADPTGGGVGVTHGYVSETVNVDPNQANFNFLQIKQAGYYAFLVYGGDGGMGGSGTARSARGAGGRASGIATMTLNEYVGGAIAMQRPQLKLNVRFTIDGILLFLTLGYSWMLGFIGTDGGDGA